MAGNTTTYAVEVVYRAKDQRAKQTIEGIGKSAEVAARATGGLATALGGVAAAVAGFGALRVAKAAFIDFNNSVEMSTISLAAQEKMLLKSGWGDAMGRATELFADYQQVAANSVGETRDFIAMHQGIASSAYRAGLGFRELRDMTVGATIAATALGERADMVALDVKQMLSGDVTSRDRTAQILLASQGVSQDRFNAMSQKQRNAIIKAALNDPALKSAAEAYGASFAGVTSTLKDNISIAAGKVGLPLFRAITDEVKKWNAWIEQNPQKIRQFAADFTKALKDGFTVVKQVMRFIVDNRELLVTLAKAALVAKGTSMLMGGVQNMGAGVINFRKALSGAEGGLAMFAAKAQLATTALAAIAFGAQAVADWVDRRQTRNIEHQADVAVLESGAAEFRRGKNLRYDSRAARVAATQGDYAAQLMLARRMVTQAEGAGMLKRVNGKNGMSFYVATGKAGDMSDSYAQTLAEAMRMVQHPLNQLVDQMRENTYAAQRLAGALQWEREYRSDYDKMMKAIAKSGEIADRYNPTKQNVTVNQRNEVTVVTEDPDRFSMALTKVALRSVKNPTGAKTVYREG